MKFLLRSVLFLFFMILLLLIPFFFWLQSDIGKETVENYIIGYIEKKLSNNYKINIEDFDLSFSPSFTIEVKKISFFDEKGEFANVEDFHIDAVPSFLWLWQIGINEVSAEKISLSRLPVNKFSSASKEKEEKLQKTKSSNLKFIPKIFFKNIFVHKLVLSAELTRLKNDIDLNFSGYLSIIPQDKKLNFTAKVRSDLTKKLVSFDKNFTLLENITLKTKGVFDFQDKKLGLEEVTFSSPHSAINAVINIDLLRNSLSGTMNYKSSILDHILPNRKVNRDIVKNSCSGKVEIFGDLSSPHVIANGVIGHIDIAGNYFRLPNLNWNLDLLLYKNGGNGSILFEAGGVKISGLVKKDKQKIYFNNFSANNSEDLIAKANLYFDIETKKSIGSFDFNTSNINELQQFFPFLSKDQMAINGKLNLAANYKGDNLGTGKLKILGSAKDFSSIFSKGNSLNFDIDIKNLRNLELVYADIRGESLIGDYGQIKKITIEAQGKEKENSIDFTSHIESKKPYLMDLKISGNLLTSYLFGNKFADNNLKLRVNDVIGKINEAKISLPKSILINFAEDFSLSAPHIKLGSGKLNLDLYLSDSQIYGKMLTEKIPVTNFVPLSFSSPKLKQIFSQSLISGQVKLSGSLSSPNLESLFTISGIKYLTKTGAPLSLKLSSNIQDNYLFINSAADFNSSTNTKRSLAVLKLKSACKFSLSPFKFVLKKNDINGNLKIKKNANILELLPLPTEHKLKGDLNGNLNIFGDLESLSVNGVLSIDKAGYKYNNYGVNLKNIFAKITVKNNKIFISNFIVQDAYANSLKGDGEITINKNIPFKFNISTENFNLINTAYVQGKIQGDLFVSGNKKKALAQGSIEVGPMEIKIPDRFSNNVRALNIVESIDGNKVIHKNKEKIYEFGLDVDLKTKKQVYVRGKGVNTLLFGKLKIIGNISSPQIFGELKSSRGRFQEFGKLLTIKKGVLSFNGSIPPSPYLNIEATATSGETEIILMLSGSILKPSLSIESVPILNQEEALSLLLFGENANNISAVQAVSLANGMRKLSGSTGEFDPLGISRKILQVDDITIKSDVDTESSYVGIGKYLTDKVYLELEQGSQVFGTKTKIEVELTPKISFEAIASDKKDSSLGVNWKFDY